MTMLLTELTRLCIVCVCVCVCVCQREPKHLGDIWRPEPFERKHADHAWSLTTTPGYRREPTEEQVLDTARLHTQAATCHT